MYQELREAWQDMIGPGGAFEVVEIEQRGQRVKVYKNAPLTVRDLWLASAVHGDADYLVFGDERWTYAEAHRDAAAIANWLLANGVEPGDRVAIAMRNYPEWMLAYWACLSIGVAAVGVNAWWVGAEMVYGINDADPKVIILDQERLDRLSEHRDEIGERVLVGVRLDGYPEDIVPWAELVADPAPMPEVDVDPDADAAIFYTSGTTGFPKGARLTHRSCIQNIMSLGFSAAVQAEAIRRATGAAEVAPQPPGQPASLITTPLFHVTANNCVAYGATAAGGKLVHMYRWDPGEALRLIESEKITGMSGVPVMARELISHPDFDKTDTSSLRSLGGGGAALQPDLVKKIDESVATARPNTGYGMTEASGIITAVSADFFVDRPDSAGPAMPVYDIKCVNELGEEVPLGESGELWVRGGHVIKGYLNRPDATAETITDGWLHTGDIARIDEDGFIYIMDRVKDMVLRGGENVYCAEVEAAMFAHDDVAECAAFSIPDDRLGEEVGAAIVRRAGSSLTAAEIRAHCESRIAKFKIPRYIWFSDEQLPRNASGKFLKSELRDSLDVAAAE